MIDPMNRTDQSLEDIATIVNQSRDGRSEAFNTLVQRFQDMAVGYSYSILGDFGLAEDAAQEAFLNAYLSLSQLKTPAAFPGWFRRIVFKQCDRLVRGKQKVIVPIDNIEDVAASTFALDASYIQRETASEVHQAIASLPLHEREIITLFYIGQHSQKEIASFLELPASTVKSRLYSARQRLKERLITMIQESLPEQRPSRDTAFADSVQTLFQATTSGDINAVRRLLDQEPTLAQASGMVQSPIWQSEASALHMAVMYGRKDIVDLLLAHGADINEQDEKEKFTPLHQAIDLAFMPAYKALKMPAFLLERGAKPDIFSALWSGKDEAVKEFVRNEPSLVNAVGPGNCTPLCYTHTVEMAEFLLDNGADMFFDLACRWPAATPIQGADGVIFELMRKRAGIEDDIFIACKRGESKQVLVQLESDPALLNVRTSEEHFLGRDLMLLHLAATYGLTDVAQRLIELGADVSARVPALMDMTPLHIAIWRGKKEMLESFPDDVEEIPGQGVYRLLTEMPRLLLAHGADSQAKDSEANRTPLAWAEANIDDSTDRSEVAALLRDFV